MLDVELLVVSSTWVCKNWHSWTFSSVATGEHLDEKYQLVVLLGQ